MFTHEKQLATQAELMANKQEAPSVSDDALRLALEEGLRLRRKLERCLAPLKVLTPDDLRVCAR